MHRPPLLRRATLFVVSYSFALSVSLPFFSTLVGLVTASTYLICAYGLPAWFALKLLPKVGGWGNETCHSCRPLRAVTVCIFVGDGWEPRVSWNLSLQISIFEKALLWLLIPASLVLSGGCQRQEQGSDTPCQRAGCLCCDT
jgi:hypothetical protein